MNRLIAIGLLAVVACRAPQSPAPPTPATLSGPEQARADSLRLPYTEADVTFMRDMISHHAQAILISRWAVTHGADAAVQRLAGRIIVSQSDEIVTMQTWLKDRGRPAPVVDSMGHFTPAADPNNAHAGHNMAGMDHANMPGMLSAAELTELDAARGADFDGLFLRRMIAHHRGALTMVQTLVHSPRAAQDETVFLLASEIEAGQSAEINRMTQMLFSLGSGSPQ